MNINISNGFLNEDEVNYYIKYVQNKFPKKKINELNLELDGDFINLTYTFLNDMPYERIKRITNK